MSSSNFTVAPELLSNEDINHFQSVIDALTNDSVNILIVSDDKKTTSFIHDLIKQKLIAKDSKNFSFYQHEKLEAFMADSLLGPFENAFSKINEMDNSKERPIKKILFINDISKLDEREVNLLVSLNSKKLESFNSIVVFFQDSIKTSYNKNKLLDLFDKSIKWEPDTITKTSDISNNNIEKNFHKTNNSKSYSRSKKIFLSLALLGILSSVPFFSTINTSSLDKYTNQVLNFFKTFEMPYLDSSINSFFEKELLIDTKNNIIKSDDASKIEVLNLSDLSQFHVSTGYIIQYSAHLKKGSALKWISKQSNITDFKIIVLEKTSDNSNFYAVVSKPFINYKQAVDYAVNKKLSGKTWVRSLESVKKSQAKQNHIDIYF